MCSVHGSARAGGLFGGLKCLLRRECGQAGCGPLCPGWRPQGGAFPGVLAVLKARGSIVEENAAWIVGVAVGIAIVACQIVMVDRRETVTGVVVQSMAPGTIEVQVSDSAARKRVGCWDGLPVRATLRSADGLRVWTRDGEVACVRRDSSGQVFIGVNLGAGRGDDDSAARLVVTVQRRTLWHWMLSRANGSLGGGK